ncbi:restriction endonuclease subunit S [Thiothrix lacustris]|uniref:Restriction endonuclease subunit S n=1 Tax=Thiothrix lacustris TaxID=525917 RepID=A0ABY9MUZ2_9GAMM|nr:restriction endonuclease subunit S [Thiothrix lacustris]WML92272.1 restriction endonuclease subunit S [Thiothrix lacustris]
MSSLPNSWNSVKLKDIARIGDGVHASVNRLTEGVLYLSSKNFGTDRLDLSKVDYISENDYLRFFKPSLKAITKPEKDDVLLGIIGTLGAPYLVRASDRFGISSSVAIIRSNSDMVISAYLYYWFKSPIFQNAINQIKSGVAQSFLSLGMIGSLPCDYPQSIETQRKIAAILSAYDDLIENNLQRIKLLEEMAQITYEEWFVRMKFPGHETAQWDKATGLPKGWKKGCVCDISDVNRDNITVKDEPEYIHYIDIASTNTGSYNKPELMAFSEAPSRARRKLKFGDTIFSTVRPNRKTYSLILDHDPHLVASTGFAVLTPLIETQFSFVYLSVANQEFVDRAVSVAGGAAYPAVNQKDFEKISVIIPDNCLIHEFSKISNPCFETISALTKQNALLREAREILLPRLMTGVIDVDQVEVPEALLARVA